MTDAAMESTGVYWWPVYHALAQAGIEVCVCNAAHMRNVPGRKTDLADCQWIAELHEYGLLRPSFIPGAQVAALRQRTRYRKKLIEQRTSEGQRLAKVLEDAGIKIDSVASDMLGKSGRAMIEALIAGERDPARLAGLALGVLRRKTEELQMACDGRFTAGHGQMCRLHLDAYDHLTAQDRRAGRPGRRGGRAVRRAHRPAGHHPRHRAAHRRGSSIAEDRRRHDRLRHASRLAAWAGLARGDTSRGKRKKAPPARATRTYARPWSRPPGRPGAPRPPRRRLPPPGRPSAKATRRRPRSPSRTPAEHRLGVMRYDTDYIDAGAAITSNA